MGAGVKETVRAKRLRDQHRAYMCMHVWEYLVFTHTHTLTTEREGWGKRDKREKCAYLYWKYSPCDVHQIGMYYLTNMLVWAWA